MFDAKNRGWDIDLFRSRRSRWIAGVCGGLAENMNWSPTGLRIIAILLFMFTGSFAFLAYIAAWFLIASRSEAPYAGQTYNHETPPKNPNGPQNIKQKVFSHKEAATSRIYEIRDRLSSIDQRIRAMETHVTSKKYQFDRELHRTQNRKLIQSYAH